MSTPARIASCTASGPFIFVAARRRTSLPERPALSAAALIFCRAMRTFSVMLISFCPPETYLKGKRVLYFYDGALSAAGKSSTLMPPRSIGDAMSAAPPRRASTVTGTYSRTGPDTRQTVSPSSPGRMADSGTE